MNYSYDAQGYASAITVNPVSTNGVGVNTGGSVTRTDTDVTTYRWKSMLPGFLRGKEPQSCLRVQ